MRVVLFSSPPCAATPCLQVSQLTFPEQLVVWALRTWVEAPERAPCIHREFIRACGAAAGSTAFAMLRALLTVLTRAPLRPLHCHRLACASVAPDERAILGLIAAGQRCDARHLAHAAAGLVAPGMQRAALEAAVLLAAALEQGERRLPLRQADTPAPALVN